MSPQDLENFISRVQDRVMATEASVRSFTDTLNLLTENIKGFNSNTAEVKGLDSKVALFKRQVEDLKIDYTGLDKRIARLEIKPVEAKAVITPKPKKRWFDI